ncbi:MaoC/PaaZ C-terminal domain-containing protein [Streptomyces sp. NPDC046237]|uniref:MaoC family dehydratase n=1 Tax=Streptomyces sp. NPDC046237 TaxID=3154914 RepID=UPI0033C5241A
MATRDALTDLLALAGAVTRAPFTRARPDTPPPLTRITRGPLRVDEDRLAAYARLCGFPYRTGGPLPLTYPHVLGFPSAMRLMSRRDFPLPLLGLVHTWITITRHALLTAAGRPELTVYARETRPHRRGTEVTMVTEARLDGRLVWESASGYLARHARAGDTQPPQAPLLPPLLPTTTEWHLPPDLGRRYAAVSGDRNPIHLHPLTARAFGFPRTVAHGMWTFARCLAERDGEGEFPYARAEFKAPVLLPRTVRHGADSEGHFQLSSGDRLHLTGFTGFSGFSGEYEETSARSS